MGSHPQQSQQSSVPLLSQSLRHKVCEHVLRRTIFDIDRNPLDVVPDKVELDIDVLRFGMVRGVFRE
jgi:hypothetical protein